MLLMPNDKSNKLSHEEYLREMDGFMKAYPSKGKDFQILEIANPEELGTTREELAKSLHEWADLGFMLLMVREPNCDN